MATTSVSNTGTTAAGQSSITAAQLKAANKTNAQQIMTKLGAGSGVDVT